MSARLFRRIQSTFSRLNKTLLFTVGLVLLVGTITGTAIATTPADTINTYNKYLTLFDGASSGLSAPTGGTLLQDATTKNIKGFSVNVTLAFASNDSDVLTDRWSHVKDDSGAVFITADTNDTFVVRACDNLDPTHCWLNTIPYTRSVNQKEAALEGNVLITQLNEGAEELLTKNDWRNPIQVQNYPVLSPTSVNGFQNGAQYNYARTTGTNKEEGIVSDFSTNGVRFPPTSSVELTLWYCARNASVVGEGDGSQAYQTVGNNPDKYGSTIGTFGNLCSGSSYFRIGAPLSVSIPTTAQSIADQVNKQQASSGGGSATKSNLPVCGIGIVGSSGTISGCAAQIAYGIYSLTKWIAALFGQLFDFFIGYSVSDASYRYTFAVTGWKLVRDISNVFFIIILVWTGFSTVFDTNKNSIKSVLPNLIVNAILINFSLFATRVVIDISNITARMFYSEMLVCQDVNKDSSGNCIPGKTETSLGGYWPLSEAIVGAFNPQKMFNASVLQVPTYTNSTTPAAGQQFDTANTAGSLVAVPTETDYAIYFGIVCLIAAFIMIAIAVMFFKVAFLFVGRVVGLYICMIFSPFAFLSRQMPLLSGVPQLNWKSWGKELTNYALMAPLFTFFLYIIYTLLSSNFAQQIGVAGTSDGSIFGTVMAIGIPMAIIYYFMDAAQKATVKLSGDIGNAIQSFGTTVTGLAIGAATGGASLAGARVFGGAAKAVDESRVGTRIRDMAAQKGLTGFTGRTLQKGLNATRAGSFDVRETKAGRTLFKRLGVDANQKSLNLLSSVGLGLGSDQRKGGNDADIKRRADDHEKNLKLLEEKSGAAIKEHNEKHQARYNVEVTAILEQGMLTAGHTQAEITAAKNDTDQTIYNQYRNEAVAIPTVRDQINAVQKPSMAASADELTSARRKEYSDNLKDEGVIAKYLKQLAEKGGGFEKLSNVLGQVVAVGGVAGLITGSQVRANGDAVAAKKIDEKSKVDKELQKIEDTLKKGFKDLIAAELFQNEYDNLTDDQKSTVDAQQSAINTNKDERERWEKRVQAVELSRYNIRDLKKTNATLKATMLANGTPANINAYFDSLDEIEAATKHEKVWRDIGRYREEQKKKLKDE